MALPVLLQWFENQQEKLMQHPLSSSFFLLSVFFLLWLNRVWAKKVSNLPPSPPKLPIIGHLHRLGMLPHRSLHALSKEYGPLMLLHLGQTPTLVVSSAEMAKEIMKTHDVIFANRPITTATKTFLYGSKDNGYSSKDIGFAPYGEHWRQMRKFCVLDLLSVKRVQSFKFVRDEEIAKMVNKIKQSCSMRSEMNLSDLIIAVTSNVISRSALSKKLEKKSEYADLTSETMELFGRSSVEDMFPSLWWVDVLTGLAGRMKKTSQAMHQFLDEVIEEHLLARKSDDGQGDRKDFLDLLIDYEKDAPSGVEFTRENIKAVIMDIFAAGTDTTHSTLEWAMAELVNHPNTMKKVQEEVRLVVGDKSEVMESEINKMDYLNCVIKETLRLHLSVVFTLPRVSTANTTIQGYNVPAKTNVLVNAWAIARNPQKWEKPDEFIPERFINNPVDFRGNDFDFIPFGAGRRVCPGISFGMASVETVLANLLYWFDWELPGGENKEDIDMTEAFGLTVHKKFPLYLRPVSHTF